jgi:ankyrin repeat protein
MTFGDAAMLDLLVSYHANVNAQDSDGWTPLMYAHSSTVDEVKLLIRHGAQVSIENSDGDTALDLARKEWQDSPDRKEILRILTGAAAREAAGD